MKTALLLIALGFGFKIFVEAYSSRRKTIKHIGLIVATIMMLFSFLGALCTISHKIKDLSVKYRYQVRRIFDWAGTGKRLTQKNGLRLEYEIEKKHVTIYPYFSFSFRDQQDFNPKEIDRTRDFEWGIDVALFDRFRLNANYGYNTVDRQEVGQDTIANVFDVRLEWDVLKDFMIIGSFRYYGNNFQTQALDYAEKVGEIRFVYKI